jgi:hypothetical protein
MINGEADKQILSEGRYIVAIVVALLVELCALTFVQQANFMYEWCTWSCLTSGKWLVNELRVLV